MGTVLSISQDNAGMAVSYLGYGLLFLFILLSIINRNSVFQNVNAGYWKSPFRKIVTILFLLLLFSGVKTANAQKLVSEFNKLIKNPTKLMGLVKNVGDKLDSRIKSGEIKESELIAEASEIMNKMKNMPGLGDIQSMLSKMGLGGLGGLGGKVNMGAMEAQLNKNMKQAKTLAHVRALLLEVVRLLVGDSAQLLQ
jgi:hypothetical protein